MSVASGQFSLKINFGGRPFWCKFDYTVETIPERELVVALGDKPDSETQRWFPSLARGMESAFARRNKDSTDEVGHSIKIQRVYSHPVDTTERGCEYYGAAFIDKLYED